MTPAIAIERVVGAALSAVGVREVGKDNHGEQVARYLKATGLGQGYPWCAAFQAYNGHGALLDPITSKSSWPLPMTAACSQLGDFAEQHNVLYTTPAVGDLMLFWEYVASEKRSRFAHVGLVVALATAKVITVEGNTNDDGSRNGWGVLLKQRNYGGDLKHHFVRWSALLK